MSCVFVALAAALLCACMHSALSTPVSAYNYNVTVLSIEPQPVLSYINGSSTFQQVFNAAYLPASSGSHGKAGLLVRSQNCSADVGGDCVHCSGAGQEASVWTFAELLLGGDAITPPVFANVNASTVVFGPQSNFDTYGTEDPRATYDPLTGLYYVFYTSYGEVSPTVNSIYLSLATTQDPTTNGSWQRHGAVFPQVDGSKSAALLIRSSPPHYLLWGDTDIRIAQSNNLTSWPDVGEVLLSPRADYFDSQLVEAGPNPMLLSSGDYLFVHNSAGAGGYHVGWVILSGADPTVILQRSDIPLFSPTFLWEQGLAPWTCNVGDVIFLQGIAETEVPNTFRVYFGGADAVIGTAVIQVNFET